MILDELKVYAIRQRREALAYRQTGRPDEALVCEQRAAMADRGVLLARAAELGDPSGKWLYNNGELVSRARAAGLIAVELDPGLEPPAMPAIDPSPSAGWDADQEVLTVWRSDWENPDWRRHNSEASRARYFGKPVRVIDEPGPGKPFYVTGDQLRDPDWILMNNRVLMAKYREGEGLAVQVG
jgi:hypothetical protein